MTREKVGGDIETVCKVDNRIVARILKCSEWEGKKESKKEK
jgi:hypothetical protein